MNTLKTNIGRHRWTICALMFFATTINYVDRNILGILAPTLQKEINWSPVEYGYITMAFQAAYAIGMAFFGWFVDKYGTKIGYALSIVGWSIAAMGHGLVHSALGFGVVRFFLGLSEAGNFPAAVKTTAEWFPKKERALATGIFNAGTNTGAMLAPAIVPWLTVMYGWQAAFIATGALGFIWVVFWLFMYEKPESSKKVSKEELEHILSDQEEIVTEKVSWIKLLEYRQTWAFIFAKILSDPAWWFYLFWLGLFFNKNFGLSLTELGLPLIIIYTMTDIGSITGGWVSGALIKHGVPIHKARKRTLFACALCILPVMMAPHVSNLWIAVGVIALALTAHQAWSANLWTTVSDMFPKKAVGSVVGLGAAVGSIGGMIFFISSGYILEATGSYSLLFFFCGSAYSVAVLLMHLLTARAKPVEL